MRVSASSAVDVSWMPRPLQRVTPGGTSGRKLSTPAVRVCTTRRPGIRGARGPPSRPGTAARRTPRRRPSRARRRCRRPPRSAGSPGGSPSRSGSNGSQTRGAVTPLEVSETAVQGDRAGVGQRRHLVDHDPEPGPRRRRRPSQSSANGRSRALGAAVGQRARPARPAAPAAAPSTGDPVLGLHDVVGGDPLEHRDLEPGGVRHDEVGGVPHERAVAGRERRVLDRAAEPADQVAGEVLQRRQVPPAAVVRPRPASSTSRSSPSSTSSRASSVDAGEVPVADRRPHRRPVERGQVDPAGDDAVLDVVDGVGDVVGEVHDLRLEAAPACPRRPRAASRRPAGRRRRPRTCGSRAASRRRARPAAASAPGARPGVLRAGVEGRPGQVEPDRAPVGVEGLGLQPGQQPQRLGVALEAAAVLAELGQHPLAVVAERRVAEVVGQRRGLGDVGLAAQRRGPGRGRPGRPRGCGSAGCGRSRRSAARPPGSWPRAAATPPRAPPGPGRARTGCARARPPAWAARRRSARARRRRTGPGTPSEVTLLPAPPTAAARADVVGDATQYVVTWTWS